MRYTLDTRITRCCLPSVCFNHLRRSGNVQLLFPRRSILTLITDYSGHRPRSRWLPIESRGDQMLDSSAWDCDLFSVFATTLIKFFIYGHVCHGKNWCDYLWLITWPMPHCLLGSARPPRSDWPDFSTELSYHQPHISSYLIINDPTRFLPQIILSHGEHRISCYLISSSPLTMTLAVFHIIEPVQ